MKSLLPSYSDSASAPLGAFDDKESASSAVISSDGVLAPPRFSCRFERDRDEDELVRRCGLSGAQRSEAVIQILERLEPAAFLICNLLIEDRLEAAATSEDACVEAVTRLFEGAPVNASHFRVTFFRILRRHSQKRAAMRRPANNVAHSEFRALIADMSERERWVSVLRFVAGLSRAEIAMVLGLSVSDVKSDLWIGFRQIMAIYLANGV